MLSKEVIRKMYPQYEAVVAGYIYESNQWVGGNYRVLRNPGEISRTVGGFNRAKRMEGKFFVYGGLLDKNANIPQEEVFKCLDLSTIMWNSEKDDNVILMSVLTSLYYKATSANTDADIEALAYWEKNKYGCS